MNYETVIGIEIHCELNTKTKMFSSAPNAFGAAPNTLVSPVDMAFPGIMPVVNKKAVESAIIACTALGLTVDDTLVFDRKNYFYPDLPKGFQITQNLRPIGKNGKLEIEVDGKKKSIGIERLHMEEDTAKQLHFTDYTLINYNRCGVPLIEIVSNPDIASGKEAAAYVDKLRSILLYTGVSNVRMEEGSMRCDVNVSIRPEGQKEYGVKTEIKNLNSINNIMKAVDYEVERQKQLILSGGQVEPETRRFDEATKQTILMRKKTSAVDYKYFTEPNVMPIHLDHEWIRKIQASVPELPNERKERYMNTLQLAEYDASVLVADKNLSDFFEQVVAICGQPKMAANWMIGTVMALLNKNNIEISKVSFSSQQLGDLIKMIGDNTISTKQAREIFDEMVTSGKNPQVIAKEKNMMQISDESAILGWVSEVLDANPQAIETYKGGRQNILGFLVGQVLKKSQGKANPALVNKMMREEIEKK